MKNSSNEIIQILHQRAEEKFRALESASLESLSTNEIQQLIHELQVHQIELEMQNEELHRSQNELESSRRNYFDLYYLAQDGYLTLDANGLIWKANLAAASMLGTLRNDLLKKPVTSIILPKDQNIYYLHYKKFLKDQKPMTCELRLIKKDGTAFWAQLSLTALQSHSISPNQDDTRTAVYHLAFRDISDRKQVEVALLKSERENAFKAEILRKAPVIAAFHNKDLSIVWANQAYEKATGLPLADIIGKKCFTFWGYSDPCNNCPVEAAIKTGKHHEAEITPQNHGNWSESRGYWLLNAEPFFDSNGKILGAIETGIEISDRIRIETSLRESEEKYRAMIDAFEGYMYICSKDFRIEYMNERLIQRTGRDATGEYCYKALHDLDSVCEWCVNSKIFAGECLRWEIQSPKDGRWYEVNNSPIYNANGTISKQAMITDITNRKHAEVELQRKSNEIEEILYTVSHDLRSPLVTVKTFLGYLEKDMAVSDRERIVQDLQYIHGATDKMSLLLDELLELSRIDRVKTPPVKVSLKEILTEVLDALAGVISERKVEINMPDSDLELFGERPRLCQIWQNLIENAIKYSRDNSIPRVELGVQQVNGETVYYVKDNGIGIDPQYHSKIFGIFEKLDHKSSGAGLGLSMIQRIVEKDGGRVWVESKGIGKGSCFMFTLPNAVNSTDCSDEANR